MKTNERSAEPEAKRRILDVAAQLFSEKGLDGARVDEIAERANVNKAMVYYYVGEKDRLYETVLLETIGHALAEVDRATSAEKGAERKLRALLEVLAEQMTTRAHFPTLMLREISSGGRSLPPSVVALMARIFEHVAAILAEGQKEGVFRKVDPIVAHNMIAGSMVVLVAGTPLRARVRRMNKRTAAAIAEPSAHDLAEFVAEMILHGISLKKRARRRVPSAAVKSVAARRKR